MSDVWIAGIAVSLVMVVTVGLRYRMKFLGLQEARARGESDVERRYRRGLVVNLGSLGAILVAAGVAAGLSTGGSVFVYSMILLGLIIGAKAVRVSSTG
ncbi:MAG: hypothetical protein ABR564_08140 [Candidatus Dormibacteria bacterium]